MKVIDSITSPNFSQQVIPVEFCIIHYTACDLKTTLEIFQNFKTRVCSHFVVDTSGDVYDLGNFLSGPIYQGAHAGQSRVTTSGKTFEKINSCSIGIEVINLNGNIFPYTDEQYMALQDLGQTLMSRFPNLHSAERFIGHEHIAGFRGKADPGLKFDWNKFLASLGLSMTTTHKHNSCTADDLAFLKRKIPEPRPTSQQFWMELNTELEERIRDRNQAILS